MNPVTDNTHPTAVFRVRQEPVHVPAHFPIGTVIEVATTRRELAPQPVPQSAFDSVGRAAPPRINRPVTNLAFSEWLGVMAWPFKLLKVPTPMRAPGSPNPGMMPFTERVNIAMPPQVTYGDQTSIKGQMWTGPQYGKLGWPL
jgi:hypothetical protein